MKKTWIVAALLVCSMPHMLMAETAPEATTQIESTEVVEQEEKTEEEKTEEEKTEEEATTEEKVKKKTEKKKKQMMEMKSGGSAELTASESEDYMLPFIGELRELIDENEELFNEADEVKQLLLQYLNEKEATANYPYIYIKRVKPVENQSYIVKLTFDYFNGKYTLLQHITGSCKDLGMGRMNDAIEYFSRSSSFVKGEKI